ncbi:MAG: protein-export chaperone SecB [Thiotrichaceae bacterium]|nr:protein-export chaperone SecB [Thiotrichaceae bacterium]
MEEAIQNGAAPQEQFAIQKVYVKDVSFETPNSPYIFTEQWTQGLELQISNTIEALSEDVFEVVLNLTVTVKAVSTNPETGESSDKTAYLIEVQQAGIFTVSNFGSEQLQYMLNSYCLTILFPYAREVMSDLSVRGGFQPLLLAPINFDAMFAQRVAQLQQDAAAQLPEATA